jgi:hypothetical protein
MSSRISPALLLALLLVTGSARAQVDEYQVKAAFLYNFAKFVEWPPHVFKTGKDPITICIFGQSPLGNALDEAVAGKLVEGRPFLIRSIEEIVPTCNCQILFVGSAERKRFRSFAGNLRGAGILTVGETQGFASSGGVINFKLEGGRIRLEINPEAAERSQLRISSKLLSLAEIVKGERER